MGRSGTAIARGAAAALSGVLLALCYPPFEVAGLAWVALVPLIVAAVRCPPREAFRWGFLSGAVFWVATLAWLWRLRETSGAPPALVLLGWGALSAYCAAFTGAFALTAAWLGRAIGAQSVVRTTALTAVLPVVWTGLEFVRYEAFQGFPWNALGVTQFRVVPLLQIAQWTGVYGVSALVALANAAVAATALRYLPGRPVGRYRPHPEIFIAMLAVVLVFRVGLILSRPYGRPADAPTAVVAAIQPDIAQTQKWDPAQGEEILDRLETLTDQAAAEPEPDLVVWPETTTPDSLSLDGLSRALVTNLVHRHGVPLLAGAVHVAAEGDGYRYYNSAFLFTPGEGLAERYDKQHLVPFGEYIPLSGWLPWLERLAPLGWTCAAGRRATVFRLADPPLAFSSLICFEDTVSGLARAFVRRGARVLINQTNDAWFDRTAGPVQHLSQSVFRCVENRVPMVRVANTGITALVDPSGRIRDAIGSTARQTPAAGWRNWAVVAPPPGRAPTAYTRHGDALFGLPCAGVAALAFLLALRAAWRKDSTRSGVVPAAGGTEIP